VSAGSPRRSLSSRACQGGFLSLLYSIGSKPLQIWDKQVQNGHIKARQRDATRAWTRPAQSTVDCVLRCAVGVLA
jgi:hypothetical protein